MSLNFNKLWKLLVVLTDMLAAFYNFFYAHKKYLILYYNDVCFDEDYMDQSGQT